MLIIYKKRRNNEIPQFFPGTKRGEIAAAIAPLFFSIEAYLLASSATLTTCTSCAFSVLVVFTDAFLVAQQLPPEADAFVAQAFASFVEHDLASPVPSVLTVLASVDVCVVEALAFLDEQPSPQAAAVVTVAARHKATAARKCCIFIIHTPKRYCGKQWATILSTFLVRIKCKNVCRHLSSRFPVLSQQPIRRALRYSTHDNGRYCFADRLQCRQEYFEKCPVNDKLLRFCAPRSDHRTISKLYSTKSTGTGLAR